MYFLLPDAKTYFPGPGRCIYCPPDAPTNTLLKREHIIAFKLGGNLILHRASCKACERLINKEIETPCLTKTWLAARTHLGMKTSTPRETLPIGTWDDDGEGLPKSMADRNFRFEQIKVSEHPFVLSMVRFKEPGILRGAEPRTDFEVIALGMYWDPANIVRFPKQPEGRTAAEMQSFNPSALCRMIAKIGHGAAIAEFGLDAFTPLLPDIITGRSPYVSHLVGTAPGRQRRRRSLHRITMSLEQGFIVANIQLFSQLRTPVFQAVVGRPILDVFRERIRLVPEGLHSSAVELPLRWIDGLPINTTVGIRQALMEHGS